MEVSEGTTGRQTVQEKRRKAGGRKLSLDRRKTR